MSSEVQIEIVDNSDFEVTVDSVINTPEIVQEIKQVIINAETQVSSIEVLVGPPGPPGLPGTNSGDSALGNVLLSNLSPGDTLVLDSGLSWVNIAKQSLVDGGNF